MNFEKTLLGGIIKSPHLIDSVATKLVPGDFLNQQNQTIYKKILEIYKRKGFFDYFVLEESLNDEKIMEYLLELLADSKEFKYEELSQHILKIKEDKKIERLKALGAFLTDQQTFASNSADWLLEQATKQLFTLSEMQEKKESIQEDIAIQMFEEIEKNRGKELWGFSTGFKELDRSTRGLQQGHIWVVGAYTSVGKSWFCLHLGKYANSSGARVLYLSTEMVERRLAWRLVTMKTGIPEYTMIMDRLSPEERERRDRAIEEVKDGSFRFVSGITKIDQVLFEIKREIALRKCDVVIVDFIQNLATGRDEYEELSNAIIKLQSLALTENICVIVASQVNRESQKSGLGGAFGYKGSGTIEAAADVGIILKKEPERNNEIKVDVRKNRNGFSTDFVVTTDFSIGRFEE